jgi:tripartite-type tricarboxylate transporter receptor subunit TctC
MYDEVARVRDDVCHGRSMTVLKRLFVCVFLAISGTAFAESYPARPIRLIVPHAPGGNSDTFGRILAQKLTERIGQQVVVENRPGAGGTVGSALVSKAAADGYTLVVADNGTHAIAPTLYGTKLSYDVYRDFTPIMLAASFPTVIMIHPSVPAQNAQEFVALAKSQPGKLTYSSAGTGNGSHLTVELFRAAAGGLDMVHVPYKGGAPAVQALLAGEVQLSSVSVNTALPHIQAGTVRALGVASAKRSPALPDVPTFNESGIAFEGDSWLAIMGPSGSGKSTLVNDILYRSLSANGSALLARGRLRALRRAVEVFGFHLATVDLRQSSDQHELVITELLRAARLEPDYAALEVMDMVLGGLFSSRINLNLREAHG